MTKNQNRNISQISNELEFSIRNIDAQSIIEYNTLPLVGEVNPVNLIELNVSLANDVDELNLRLDYLIKKLVAVGGRNTVPENSSRFLQAIEITLNSKIGCMSVQGLQLKEVTFVESLATLNVLYVKQKLLDIGLFNENLLSEAEDADLNYRLFSKGSKFAFIPESFVIHKMRANFLSWFKNMFRYGKGRARLLKRYRR